MKPKETILSSYDKTKRVAMEGYACTLCNRFWGDHQNGAANCCATSSACEDCGKPGFLYHRFCRACSDAKKAEKFRKFYEESAVDWDGVTPLYSDAYDQYIFGDVADWAESIVADWEDEIPLTRELIESWQLRLCTPNNGRHFDLNEFLCDDLADGETLDSEEVEKVVNDFIKSCAPISWSGDGKPVTLESVCKALEVE